MEHYVWITTPMGTMTALEEDGALTRLDFGKIDPAGAEYGETDLLKETLRQMGEYFSGTRREFTLPLAPRGTAFQMKVWNALSAIPYGQTRSYRDIALQAGIPSATRAVGGANHRNPISIIIPCHRVIGANGSLTGYGGGLDKKEALLALEHGERLV